MHILPIVILSLLGFSSQAIAAPPSSCAKKFTGVWNHQGMGQSNIATLTADGTAACSGNPNCSQGTWTCSGDTLIYTNAGGTFNYALQPDGSMTYGSGIRVTRIGRSPATTPTPSSVQSTPPESTDQCRAAEAKVKALHERDRTLNRVLLRMVTINNCGIVQAMNRRADISRELEALTTGPSCSNITLRRATLSASQEATIQNFKSRCETELANQPKTEPSSVNRAGNAIREGVKDKLLCVKNSEGNCLPPKPDPDKAKCCGIRG